jgi:hypothetical protein
MIKAVNAYMVMRCTLPMFSSILGLIKEKGNMVRVISPQYKMVGMKPNSGFHPSTKTPLPERCPLNTIMIQQKEVIEKSVEIKTAKSKHLFFCQK